MLIPFLIFLPAILAAVVPYYKVFSQYPRKKTKGCVVYIQVPDNGSCDTLEKVLTNLIDASDEFYGGFENLYINTSLSRSHNLVMVFLPIHPDHITELLSKTENIPIYEHNRYAIVRNITKNYLSKYYPKKFSYYIAKANSQKMFAISKESINNIKLKESINSIKFYKLSRKFIAGFIGNNHNHGYDTYLESLEIVTIDIRMLYDESRITNYSNQVNI